MGVVINVSKEEFEDNRNNNIKIPFLVLDNICFEMAESGASYITVKELSKYLAEFIEGN